MCASYATTPSRSPWRNKNRPVQGTDNHLLWYRPQNNNNSPMWCQYTRCSDMDKTDQLKVCQKIVEMVSRCLTPTEPRYSKEYKENAWQSHMAYKKWMFPILVKVNSRKRPFTTLTNLPEKSSCVSIKTSTVHPKVPKIWHPSQVPVREDNPSCRPLDKSASMKIEKVHHRINFIMINMKIINTE